LLKMLYSPTESETISNSATPRDASVSFQSHSLPRERRIGVFNSGLDAGALAACDELTEFSIIFNFFQTKNRLRPLELYPKGQPAFIAYHIATLSKLQECSLVLSLKSVSDEVENLGVGDDVVVGVGIGWSDDDVVILNCGDVLKSSAVSNQVRCWRVVWLIGRNSCVTVQNQKVIWVGLRDCL